MRTPYTYRINGFTLIELLIVVTIISIIVGVCFPLIHLAQRTAKITNTKTVLAKVGVSIRQFRYDVGVWPYRSWGIRDQPDRMGNDLGRRLGSHLDDQRTADLYTDIAKAVSNYGIRDISKPIVDESVGLRAYYYYDGKSVQPYIPERANQLTSPSNEHRIALNRLAVDRARHAIIAGAYCVRAPSWNSQLDRWIGNDMCQINNGPLLVPNPRISPDQAGWCDDYLSGELTKSDIVPNADGAILDKFGHKLIYVCPIIPGVSGYSARVNEPSINTWFYGLCAACRAPPMSYESVPVDIRTEALTFPDTDQPEIWSAGPDGLFDPQFNSTVNRDNISWNR